MYAKTLLFFLLNTHFPYAVTGGFCGFAGLEWPLPVAATHVINPDNFGLKEAGHEIKKNDSWCRLTMQW